VSLPKGDSSDLLIDDAIHRLQFEKRWRSLTESQLEHMSEHLRPHQRERLDKCESQEEFDHVIADIARHRFFIRCAWSDYLNGICDDPPAPGEGFDDSGRKNGTEPNPASTIAP